MPLFAVCAVAAPELLGKLKECAVALAEAKATDDVDECLPLKLLADVREVWPGRAIHVLTATLLDLLNNIPDSPWRDYGLNPRKLAQVLRPFGVEPRQVRLLSSTGKGYTRADVDQALSRYLPSPSVQSETSETSRANTGADAYAGAETGS